MKQLLEFEAKRLASSAGLLVPRGEVVVTAERAAAYAQTLGKTVVVKAQLRRGGRGKAGWVRVTPRTEVKRVAEGMLGELHAAHEPTAQLLIEDFVPGRHEVYVGVGVSARARAAVLIVTGHGGVEVDLEHTDTRQVEVPIVGGLEESHVLEAAEGLDADVMQILIEPCMKIWEIFTSQRALLVEVNPLLITQDMLAVAADVRIVLPEDLPVTQNERSFAEDGFDFVELDAGGAVGLVTTGAGASMMLVDLLRERGLRPINFCDIRSGGLRGSDERLCDAIRTLNAYPNLRCVAVNVFAGVTSLEEFATLLLSAFEQERPTAHVVVRIEGSGAPDARKLLERAGVECAVSFEGLIDAVARVVGSTSAGESRPR